MIVKKLSGIRFVLGFLFLMQLSVSPVRADIEAVEQALSARHDIPSNARLEALAGGEDALVDALMTLRLEGKPSYVALRAERLLLSSFSARGDVQAALAEDLTNESRLGLAKLIARNIDQVSAEAARTALARALLERADSDQRFHRYARNLRSSRHSALRALARQAE